MWLQDNLRFFWHFLNRPVSVGAIAPSSRFLARAMVDGLELHEGGVVVELGPGTGALTRVIDARASADTAIVAIDKNADFARLIAERFPRVQAVHAGAQDVARILSDRGLESVDRVVSALPWAVFPPELQLEILDAVVASMTPGGQFVTFAYIHGLVLPSGRRLRALLYSHFSSVTRSRIVWRNLPPAVVYRCVK